MLEKHFVVPHAAVQEYGTTAYATPQAFEHNGRTMPMAMTSRAAPILLLPSSLGCPPRVKDGGYHLAGFPRGAVLLLQQGRMS